ncbi:hypothetical protein GS495_25250 [Rhodococcus hoagii]|nr:hypothetical protein [Prescottella equi]
MTTAAPRATIPDIDGAPMQDLDPAPAVTAPVTRRPMQVCSISSSTSISVTSERSRAHPHYPAAPQPGRRCTRFHVDKSTISRRWTPFVAAAKAEGFTVPPLPRPILAEARTQQIRELQPA